MNDSTASSRWWVDKGTWPDKEEEEEDDLCWILRQDRIRVSVRDKRILKAGMTFEDAFSPNALNVWLDICHHVMQL